MTAKETERLAVVETKMDSFFDLLQAHMAEESRVVKIVIWAASGVLGALVAWLTWLTLDHMDTGSDLAVVQEQIHSIREDIDQIPDEIVNRLDELWEVSN